MNIKLPLSLSAVGLLALAACSGGAKPVSGAVSGTWIEQRADTTSFRFTPADASWVERLHADVGFGRRQVEGFFGTRFRQPITVEIHPDRASFTAWMRATWNDPDFEPQCWMVASADARGLNMLSPRVWRSEACEHDPDDAAHVRGIVAHELTHVFHGQHNPRPSLDGMEDAGWFVEGLATYVSGQLEAGHLADPAEAIRTGAAPKKLAKVWSGKYRYAVSGTLVRYVDRSLGRPVVRQLLGCSSPRRSGGASRDRRRSKTGPGSPPTRSSTECTCWH